MLRLLVVSLLLGSSLSLAAENTQAASAAVEDVGATLDPEKKLAIGPAPGIQKIQTCTFVQTQNQPWRSASVSCTAGKATVKLEFADLEKLLTGMTIYQASCVDKNSNELPDEDLKKTAAANFEKDLALTLKDMCLKKFQEQFGFTPEKNALIVRRPVTTDTSTSKVVNVGWACSVTQVKKYGRY